MIKQGLETIQTKANSLSTFILLFQIRLSANQSYFVLSRCDFIASSIGHWQELLQLRVLPPQLFLLWQLSSPDHDLLLPGMQWTQDEAQRPSGSLV